MQKQHTGFSTCEHEPQTSTLVQEDAFAELTGGGEEEADIIPELGLDKKKKKKKKREVAQMSLLVANFASCRCISLSCLTNFHCLCAG